MVDRLIGANGRMAIATTLSNVQNSAGSGNGSPVSVSLANAFVDQYGTGMLPGTLNYGVFVTPSQSCSVSVVGKSSAGFTTGLTPASNVTLAAGTLDVLVHT
jgi:hypothetical protein